MGHARLSPSGSVRWLNCPGSIALCEDMKEEEKYNTHAEEGTAAHELGELCLQSLETKPEDFLGQGLNPHPVHKPEGWIVDTEMCRHITTYTDYVYEQIDIHNDFLGVEKQVSLFYSPEEKGTSDIVAFNEETSTLHIMDLKYGKGVRVFAEGNSQLLIYGASVYKDMEELGIYEIKNIEIHIIQPRIGNICSKSYSIEDIELFMSMVNKVVTLINKGSTELNPGEKQCRWCPASGVCKAQAKAMAEALTKEFDDLDKEPCEVDLLSVSEMAQVLSKRKEVESWINAVEARCFDRLQKGEEVPGFKLVEGTTRRKWTDEDEVVKFLKNRLKKDEIYVSKIISPSQAEKVLGSMTTRSKNSFENLWHKPGGAPKIVPESDKRPPLAKYADMFENEEEELEEL